MASWVSNESEFSGEEDNVRKNWILEDTNFRRIQNPKKKIKNYSGVGLDGCQTNRNFQEIKKNEKMASGGFKILENSESQKKFFSDLKLDGCQSNQKIQKTKFQNPKNFPNFSITPFKNL